MVEFCHDGIDTVDGFAVFHVENVEMNAHGVSYSAESDNSWGSGFIPWARVIHIIQSS